MTHRMDKDSVNQIESALDMGQKAVGLIEGALENAVDDRYADAEDECQEAHSSLLGAIEALENACPELGEAADEEVDDDYDPDEDDSGDDLEDLDLD